MTNEELETIIALATLAAISDGLQDDTEQARVVEVARSLGLLAPETVIAQAMSGALTLSTLSAQLESPEAKAQRDLLASYLQRYSEATTRTEALPDVRVVSLAAASVSPASPNGESGFVIDGPWALYRMFDRVTVEPGSGPEKFFATFTLDSRKAKFEVTANSVQNPFRLRELREFSCPERL